MFRKIAMIAVPTAAFALMLCAASDSSSQAFARGMGGGMHSSSHNFGHFNHFNNFGHYNRYWGSYYGYGYGYPSYGYSYGYSYPTYCSYCYGYPSYCGYSYGYPSYGYGYFPSYWGYGRYGHNFNHNFSHFGNGRGGRR